MYTITKQFSFEAAHHLNGLPMHHQCSRQHGHSYRVEVELQSKKLDPTGFVRDYGDLDELAALLKLNYDHRDLNEIAPYSTEGIQTSAENIARALYEWCKVLWPEVSAVRVSETVKSWAEYRP